MCCKSSKKNYSGASSTLLPGFVACPWLLVPHQHKKSLLCEDNIKCLVRSVFSWKKYPKSSFVIWGFANVAITFLPPVPLQKKKKSIFFLCNLKTIWKASESNLTWAKQALSLSFCMNGKGGKERQTALPQRLLHRTRLGLGTPGHPHSCFHTPSISSAHQETRAPTPSRHKAHSTKRGTGTVLWVC